MYNNPFVLSSLYCIYFRILSTFLSCTISEILHNMYNASWVHAPPYDTKGNRQLEEFIQVDKSTISLSHYVISHPTLDLCTGSRLMNALNINSCHSPTKFLRQANLTTYTILSVFSLQVELAPRLFSP